MTAEAGGIVGTGPLLMQGEAERVDSYGFRTGILVRPAKSVPDALFSASGASRTSIRTIGEHMSAGRCLANQLRLRLPRQTPKAHIHG